MRKEFFLGLVSGIFLSTALGVASASIGQPAAAEEEHSAKNLRQLVSAISRLEEVLGWVEGSAGAVKNQNTDFILHSSMCNWGYDKLPITVASLQARLLGCETRLRKIHSANIAYLQKLGRIPQGQGDPSLDQPMPDRK
jgi:hypothetical protein